MGVRSNLALEPTAPLAYSAAAQRDTLYGEKRQRSHIHLIHSVRCWPTARHRNAGKRLSFAKKESAEGSAHRPADVGPPGKSLLMTIDTRFSKGSRPTDACPIRRTCAGVCCAA
jgi:hypothetical protein